MGLKKDILLFLAILLAVMLAQMGTSWYLAAQLGGRLFDLSRENAQRMVKTIIESESERIRQTLAGDVRRLDGMLAETAQAARQAGDFFSGQCALAHMSLENAEAARREIRRFCETALRERYPGAKGIGVSFEPGNFSRHIPYFMPYAYRQDVGQPLGRGGRASPVPRRPDMNDQDQDEIAALVGDLVASCADNLAVNHIEGHDLPDKNSVERVLDMLLSMLFPGYSRGKALSPASLPRHFRDLAIRVREELSSQCERAFAYDCRIRSGNKAVCTSCDLATDATAHLLRALPELRETLKGDVQIAYERDPAADSLDLILFCYPGIEAVATYRLAHVLHHWNVPIIPRMWTERAHSRTGIDIHPGASIGSRFFIDHGTGLVVGETTEIGDNVSLYQGVTLGALSPAAGESLRKKKRHPTIEDDVIIYAGATILGGETVIGRNSVIGGGVWLTGSVPPDTRVTIAKPELVFRKDSAGQEGGAC